MYNNGRLNANSNYLDKLYYLMKGSKYFGYSNTACQFCYCMTGGPE